jgi:UDP-glucose 6-dehydrogenase
MHDLATSDGGDWDVIKDAVAADSRIGCSHLNVVHESRPGAKAGRGAGGHCFIKDFAILRTLYEKKVGDVSGTAVMTSMEKKNKTLLKESHKDLDLLGEVYGPNGA